MIRTVTTTYIEEGRYYKRRYMRCTECTWMESELDLSSPASTAHEHELTHRQVDTPATPALHAAAV